MISAYPGAVDFEQPIQAVIPGAQGRILAVLAHTTAELNLRTVARLAGVSPAQASRVLPHLVDLGVVHRREAPPSALFTLNDEHVVGEWLRSLADVRAVVLDRMADAAQRWQPSPVSVIVFGSFARGAASVESDIDVVAVRPPGIADDDWFDPMERWRREIAALTGNQVAIISVDREEVSKALRGRSPLWNDVARDGLVVFGSSINDLRAAGG